MFKITHKNIQKYLCSYEKFDSTPSILSRVHVFICKHVCVCLQITRGGISSSRHEYFARIRFSLRTEVIVEYESIHGVYSRASILARLPNLACCDDAREAIEIMHENQPIKWHACTRYVKRQASYIKLQ